MIVKQARLIYADVCSNRNKHYNIQLHDDGSVTSRWGRIGKVENITDYPPSRGGEALYNKKIKEKLKKGYEELRVVGNAPAQPASNARDQNLEVVAKQQIETSGNPLVDALVSRLVRENIHRITSSTQITYNSSSGLFQTPLGPVTGEAIADARLLLADLFPLVLDKKFSDPEFSQKISKYFRLIPTDIGMKKFDPKSFFAASDALQKQLDILDSLEATYKAVSTTPAVDTGVQVAEKVFDLKLSLSSVSEMDRINKWFQRTNHTTHGYKNLKIVNAFAIESGSVNGRFEEKIGDIREVVHGSSGSNILSILKSGIKASPPSSAAITGRMWGDGVYGATDFSKSLQYTMGRFGGGCSGSGWILVCDFAMGKCSEPTSYGGRRPAGYDSVWARAHKTGLRFDELIVARDSQVRLKHLLEIK